MARCRSNVLRPIVWSIATGSDVICREPTPAGGHMTAPKRPQSPADNTNLRDPQDAVTSTQRLERRAAGIARLRAELLLDAQELVVFCGAVGTRQRAGLDLPAIGGDREVGDGGVLGFARAVRHHS